MFRRFWICLALLLAFGGHARAVEGDELAIDRQQVKVWTTDEPGQSLRGFRAVTTVRSSLSGLVGLLMDTAAAPRWVYRTESIQLLRRNDAMRTFTVLAELDFWPLKNRDVVVEGRIAQNPDTLTVSIDSRSVSLDALPPRDGLVRMPAMWGRWEFRPVGDGMVEVTMSGHADPGGHIPDFLVNLMIQETPFRTLLGLRRMVALPQYQRYRNPDIREPD